jgi:predicted CoA-binding protein/catechol 2,3-dioxygenase-like lactoylglutathione lyase family enzyme
MEPRLSFVTLGVADVARSRAFYEKLGFKASSASNENVTFFDAGGVVLALFGRDALAADAGVTSDGRGFPGIAMAHNVRTEAEVADVLAEAEAAGAKVLKPSQKAFWGGQTGYFTDPDGHVWEVAYNPFMPLDGRGVVTLPDAFASAPEPTDVEIADVLKSTRTFAVVGASNKPARPSFGVMEFLKAKGYDVIPVNPGLAGQEILGVRATADLASIAKPVDVVDIFRRSDAVLEAVRAAIQEKDRLGIKVLWMQLGVVNENAATEARAAGLTVIMDRCPKIEYARLIGR